MAPMDNLRKKKDKMCPLCEREQKHVKLVESKGKLVCPECHYIHYMTRR